MTARPVPTIPNRFQLLIRAILITSSIAVNGNSFAASGGSITGDTFQIDWRYPDQNTASATTTSTAPVVWNAGDGVTVTLDDDQLIIANSWLGWTGSEYISFNGFVLTDLTQSPDFNSFTLVSLTGSSPPPWAPALSFNADQLSVNFVPNGLDNAGYDAGSVYTFAFTTLAPEPTTLSLLAVALAMLLFHASRAAKTRRYGVGLDSSGLNATL